MPSIALANCEYAQNGGSDATIFAAPSNGATTTTGLIVMKLRVTRDVTDLTALQPTVTFSGGALPATGTCQIRLDVAGTDMVDGAWA